MSAAHDAPRLGWQSGVSSRYWICQCCLSCILCKLTAAYVSVDHEHRLAHAGTDVSRDVSSQPQEVSSCSDASSLLPPTAQLRSDASALLLRPSGGLTSRSTCKARTAAICFAAFLGGIRWDHMLICLLPHAWPLHATHTHKYYADKLYRAALRAS